VLGRLDPLGERHVARVLAVERQLADERRTVRQPQAQPEVVVGHHPDERCPDQHVAGEVPVEHHPAGSEPHGAQ
jgi:hypothetical protein